MNRPAWRITLAVWHALLLREAVARMFSRRAALVWLLLEPVSHIALIAFAFGGLRATVIGGMDMVLWLASGMLAFFLFKRTAMQGASAIGANQALFTYRQVLPVDTVLARCALEGFLMVLVAGIIVGVMLILGVKIPLHDPLELLMALLGLWLLGSGWALAVSVATELVPEVGNILGMVMTPLMVASGAVFPLSAVPYTWREGLMFNPIAHGVEGVRAGLSPFYHHAPELSLTYLFGSALVLAFFGLALQVRFRDRLVAM